MSSSTQGTRTVAAAAPGGAAIPAATASASSSNTYFYMDAMRFVCALGVVFSHVWQLLIGDYVATSNLVVNALYFLAGFGHAGVVLFFVLSGYWIGRSVIGRTERGGWQWGAYLIDRLSRLMVVLVPALLLGGMLDHVAANWLESTTLHDQTGSWMVRVPHEQALAWKTLLGNLAFLQGLAVPPFGSNGPLWSLAYEFWFYLWFPALWLAVRYRRPSWALLTLGLGIAYPDLTGGFLVWGTGVLLVFAERFVMANAAAAARLRGWLPWAGAAALAATLFLQRATGWWWTDGPLGLAFAAFLLGLMLRDPPRLRWVAPAARYGAQASFSLYASHFPMLAFAATLMIDRVRPQPALGPVAAAFAVMLLLVVVGWCFSQFTEVHTGAAREWLRSRLLRARAG